jgi:hypothetical protein
MAEPTLTPLQLPRILRTELQTPAPDRLIRHYDSPFGEKILNISEAKPEAMVRPHRIADDLGSKTIAGVTRRIAWHQSFSSVPNLAMPCSYKSERDGSPFAPTLTEKQCFGCNRKGGLRHVCAGPGQKERFTLLVGRGLRISLVSRDKS